MLYGCLTSQAAAQSASFRSVDTNSDSALSFEELIAAFGRNGALQILAQSDLNGDGWVTIHELRKSLEEDRPANNDRGDDDRDDGNNRDDDDDDGDGDDNDDDDDDDDD